MLEQQVYTVRGRTGCSGRRLQQLSGGVSGIDALADACGGAACSQLTAAAECKSSSWAQDLHRMQRSSSARAADNSSVTRSAGHVCCVNEA